LGFVRLGGGLEREILVIFGKHMKAYVHSYDEARRLEHWDDGDTLLEK
jgi:hypothetical protein